MPHILSTELLSGAKGKDRKEKRHIGGLPHPLGVTDVPVGEDSSPAGPLPLLSLQPPQDCLELGVLQNREEKKTSGVRGLSDLHTLSEY